VIYGWRGSRFANRSSQVVITPPSRAGGRGQTVDQVQFALQRHVHLLRRVEPEELRATFHEPLGRDDGAQVPGGDAVCEAHGQLVEPPRFQVAQPFGVRRDDGVEATQFVLHIVIRRVFGDVELRADLAVGRARDSQIPRPRCRRPNWQRVRSPKIWPERRTSRASSARSRRADAWRASSPGGRLRGFVRARPSCLAYPAGQFWPIDWETSFERCSGDDFP
jgi:hypothetical protein